MGLKEIKDGGVTSAQGFSAGGIAAGFHEDKSRMDLAVVQSDDPCCATGVFTTNKFAAAPVRLNRSLLGVLGAGVAKAVVINSGIANAATGAKGVENAKKVRKIAADALGCTDEDILVASTGVIGEQLDLAPFESALLKLQKNLPPDAQGGHDAARAIMTTDTHPKECAVTYYDEDLDTDIVVGGMVKGSGMIMPNMATMIAVITTDLSLAQTAAHTALTAAVNESFNKVTVDSDTSTNDTCILMASGKACAPYTLPTEVGSAAYQRFCSALDKVTQTLARDIAADGEGATRLITVNVKGAANDEDADKAARAIANSPLVKTAVAGREANWGRIAAALGKSHASFDQGNVDITFLGLPMLVGGIQVDFDKDQAAKAYENPEVTIDVDLHAGDAESHMWTCDLTHEYIHINGDYLS